MSGFRMLMPMHADPNVRAQALSNALESRGLLPSASASNVPRVRYGAPRPTVTAASTPSVNVKAMMPREIRAALDQLTAQVRAEAAETEPRQESKGNPADYHGGLLLVVPGAPIEYVEPIATEPQASYRPGGSPVFLVGELAPSPNYQVHTAYAEQMAALRQMVGR